MPPQMYYLCEGDAIVITDKKHPHCGSVATVQRVGMYAVIANIPVGRDGTIVQTLLYNQFEYAHPGPFMEKSQ